jgi:hypothetical protein
MLGESMIKIRDGQAPDIGDDSNVGAVYDVNTYEVQTADTYLKEALEILRYHPDKMEEEMRKELAKFLEVCPLNSWFLPEPRKQLLLPPFSNVCIPNQDVQEIIDLQDEEDAFTLGMFRT